MTAIENDQIKKLGEKIESQNAAITRIEAALLGDKFNEDGGIIKRLGHIEEKQIKSDEIIIRFKWTGSIILGVVAIIEVLYQCTSIFSTIKK